MNIKQIFTKENPTPEYYQKLQKFLWQIFILSIVVLSIIGAYYGATIDAMPYPFVFLMILTLIIYMIGQKNVYKNYNKLKFLESIESKVV